MSGSKNRGIIAALPKGVKVATYREIVRANGLDVSGGLERAVEGLIFRGDAKHLSMYVPEATVVMLRAYVSRGLL